MTNDTVKAVYYPLLRKNLQMLDILVQPEVSVTWGPALVDVTQSNVYGLMKLANITPTAWRESLVSRFGFDPVNPTEAGLSAAGVPDHRIEAAMRMAGEQAERWQDAVEDDIDGLWACEPDEASNLTPEQVYEVLAETQARGTPVICFQADREQLMKALAEDNQITLSGKGGIFVGLSDPVNGYNWSPEGLTTPVTFRPAYGGTVIVGDDALFENAVEEAYTVDTLTFVPGEPMQLSSRSEERSRLAPPHVVVEEPEATVEATRAYGR